MYLKYFILKYSPDITSSGKLKKKFINLFLYMVVQFGIIPKYPLAMIMDVFHSPIENMPKRCL